MSKAHRGTGVRQLQNHSRGVCPICKSSGIKLLYEQDVDGKKVKICKFCNANLKNKARAAAKVTAASNTSASASEEVPVASAE